MLLYLSQEGRGIGLLNKLRAYKLQEEGLDTVDANLRLGLRPTCATTGSGPRSSSDLGLTSIRILTNNPKKISGLAGYGLSVTDQIPIQHVPNPHNEAYLRAKRDRLGHTLHHQGLDFDEEMLRAEQQQDSRRRQERVSDSAARNRFALCVARFYPELADKLEAGRPRGPARGWDRGDRQVRGAGRVRAAAGGRSTPPSRAATPPWSAWVR